MLAGDHETPDRRALQLEAVAIRGRIDDAAALLADTGQPIAGIRAALDKLMSRLQEIEAQLELPGADPVLVRQVIHRRDGDRVLPARGGPGVHRDE